MYRANDSKTTPFAENAARRWLEDHARGHKPGRHEAAGDLPPGEAGGGMPEGAADTTMNRELLGWGLTLFVVAVWCISALGIGVKGTDLQPCSATRTTPNDIDA